MFPDAAIAAAISRGDVTWTRLTSISDVAWLNTAIEELTIEQQLLGGYTARPGPSPDRRWQVNNYGQIEGV